jgi:type III restriction enzyme
VFTASNRFMDTLQSVVKGLNRAGFSDKDYRAIDAQATGTAQQQGATNSEQLPLGGLFTETEAEAEVGDDLDVSTVSPDWEVAATTAAAKLSGNGSEPVAASDTAFAGAAFVAGIKARAMAENQAFEAKAQASNDDVSAELEDKMNRHKIKDIFRDEALAVRLPQFFIQVPNSGFFESDQPFQLFEREELLKEFRLSQGDATISFEDVETEVYRVDLEQLGDENYAPRAFKLAARERAQFSNYLLSLSRDSQEMNLVSRLAELIGNMVPITDPEVKAYIRRVVTGLSAEQLRDCIERDVAYVRKIKQKITTLANAHALKTFSDLLDVDRIAIRPSFALPESITPSANAQAVPKSLYVAEAAMGYFEGKVINDVANLDSVQWWHRNLSRGKGFRINGFLNHYPDFIVKTKAGRIIVLETKGDDRDNTDSELKLKLGKLWQAKAGPGFHYMMVFENNPIDGAERLADALKKIGQL